MEGYTVSPLHYLFAKYIDNDEMMPRLVEKIQNLDPKKTNVRSLVTLRKDGASDPRKIESDSFLDGGMFLLWALRYNRVTLLQNLLGDRMVQYWRFAQLKTLFWACFEQNSPFESFQVKGQILEELMKSPTMSSAFV